MRILTNYKRVERLIRTAIKDFKLDLSDITVLTEAASGPYILTPLIAAVAGAKKVIAVTRDSRYGSFDEICNYARSWVDNLEIDSSAIEITNKDINYFAKEVNLVTNLGFIRPITAEFINMLPSDAAVSLMWEPWEFRETDLDLHACQKRNIPVLGTCETHPRLQTFRYVGLCALKLLLEVNIEVFLSNILVVGSGHFGNQVEQVLTSNGANVMRLDPTIHWNPLKEDTKEFINTIDAVVICEHQVRNEVLGGKNGIPIVWLQGKNIPIIHICGNVLFEDKDRTELQIVPTEIATPGFMSVATDYVGPRPVIDLHTAGLKVGQEMVHGMRLYKNSSKAKLYALNNSPAMDFEE